MEEENKFTVREVTGVEKSAVEVEEQLLKEHEEKFEDSTNTEPEVDRVEIPTEEAPAPEEKPPEAESEPAPEPAPEEEKKEEEDNDTEDDQLPF